MECVSLSLVIPIYRGSKTIPLLMDEIEKVAAEYKQKNYPFQIIEIICVDDCSIDNSLEILYKCQEKNSAIQIIELSRNFGQHPATVAGIVHASGDWIVTLDEDLQHHPKHISTLLLHAINTNSDLVYANPLHKVYVSFIRDYGSRTIKKIISKLSGNPHTPLFYSFRLIRGSIARAAASVSIDQSYLDVSLSWFTKKVDSIQLELKDSRFIESGTSGYSFRALLSHARRLLQTSNVKIFRLGALVGFAALILGIIASLIVLGIKIWYPELIAVPGWTSVYLSTMIFGGLNAFLIGLVLENVSVLLMQSHGKPKFFVVDRQSDNIIKKWLAHNKHISENG